MRFLHGLREMIMIFAFCRKLTVLPILLKHIKEVGKAPYFTLAVILTIAEVFAYY